MLINDLIREDGIIIGEHNSSKEEALNRLIEKHFSCGNLNNKELYKEAILTRESLSTTGVGNMIAIPHAQDDSVNYPSLVAMIDKEGVDFDSMDQQPVKLLFMIAVPKDGGSQHLEILAQLCQLLMDEKLVNNLINIQTPKEFINILMKAMKPDNIEESDDTIDIVAVTACPTGIAHTYMAEKALKEKAKELGIHIQVETNGASGVKNRLSDQDISDSQCVIIAADKKVEMERFNGKKLLKVPVADAIYSTEELLKKALQQDAPIFFENEKTTNDISEKNSRGFYKHLMNGISHIIPLLMIYGVFRTICMETSFFNDILEPFLYSGSGLGSILIPLSSIGETLALCVLGAYIADSISDQPGFIVALIGSYYGRIVGCEIIEIIIIGFFSGYIVKILSKIFHKLPNKIHTIIPNLLLPIIGSLVVTSVIYFLMKYSFNYVNLISLYSNHTIILAIIAFALGIMMSIDMGGPINKIAYTLGIISIFVNNGMLMSAVMIAGMLPPIIIWGTMLISPTIFTEEELQNKWQCLIKGLCFVSEEAIPYMQRNQRGIHIPCLISSGIAALLVVLFNCKQLVPHGGIFVLPFIENPLLFLLALIISIIIGICLITLSKKTFRN